VVRFCGVSNKMKYSDSLHDQTSAQAAGINIGDPADGPAGPLTVHGWIPTPPMFVGHRTPAIALDEHLKGMGLGFAPWGEQKAVVLQMYQGQGGGVGQEGFGQQRGSGGQGIFGGEGAFDGHGAFGGQTGFDGQGAFGGQGGFAGQGGFGNPGAYGGQGAFGQQPAPVPHGGFDAGAFGEQAAANMPLPEGFGQQRAGFGGNANVHGFGVGGPPQQGQQFQANPLINSQVPQPVANNFRGQGRPVGRGHRGGPTPALLNWLRHR